MMCEFFVVFVRFVVRSVPGLHLPAACALSPVFPLSPSSSAARSGLSFPLFLTPPLTR